jgi:cell division protein FtsB
MRFFAAALLLVLLALQYRLWVSDDGLRSVLNLKKSVAAQHVENTSLVQRNGQLAAEVKDLKGGTAALEERARNDLGMIGKDETFFQVVDPASRPTGPEVPPPAPSAPVVQKTAR